MYFQFPAIAVVFNFDDLKDGLRAMEMLMQHTDPKRLGGCIIANGDIRRPPSEVMKSYNDYCVAVCGSTLDSNCIRVVFGKVEDPRLAPEHRRFITKPLIDNLGLTEMGTIDSWGRLVTDEWTRIDHDRCKESGWCYDPRAINYELDVTLRKELEDLRKPKYYRIQPPSSEM